MYVCIQLILFTFLSYQLYVPSSFEYTVVICIFPAESTLQVVFFVSLLLCTLGALQQNQCHVMHCVVY